VGNGNLLEDIKRTQKLSTHIWGKEEKPRKKYICMHMDNFARTNRKAIWK